MIGIAGRRLATGIGQQGRPKPFTASVVPSTVAHAQGKIARASEGGHEPLAQGPAHPSDIGNELPGDRPRSWRPTLLPVVPAPQANCTLVEDQALADQLVLRVRLEHLSRSRPLRRVGRNRAGCRAERPEVSAGTAKPARRAGVHVMRSPNPASGCTEILDHRTLQGPDWVIPGLSPQAASTVLSLLCRLSTEPAS